MFVIRSVKVFAALCFLASAACTTIVSGEKAGSRSEGKRYNLPLPVLEVVPNPDGTIKVENKSLPDSANEYTVSAVSLLSKYTFDIQTKNGLLQSVTMDADATGVAKEALAAGAEVGKAKMEADAKAAEAASKAATARADKVAEKKLALDQAKNKLEEMQKINGELDPDPYSPAQLAAARLEVVAAETAFQAVQGQVAMDTGGNLDAAGNPAPASLKLAWGPVYYQVVQTVVDGEPTVILRAANWQGGSGTTTPTGQREFLTSTTGKAQTPPVQDLKFQVVDSPIVSQVNGRLQFRVIADDVFDKLSANASSITKLDGDPTPRDVTVTAQIDLKTVVVDLPDELSPGLYALHINYVVKGQERRAEVAFEVKR